MDGSCKPGEIGGIFKAELSSREAEASWSVKAIEMIADALPGVGIVAAVLGYHQYHVQFGRPRIRGLQGRCCSEWYFPLESSWPMVWVFPLADLISLNQTQEFLYYHIVERSVSGFATGFLQSWRLKLVEGPFR